MKEGRYYCTYDWWDDEDNWYSIEGIWYYERNYPHMPDYETLESIEVIDAPRNRPDIFNLLDKGGNIWRYIEKQGMINPEYISEIDYDLEEL